MDQDEDDHPTEVRGVLVKVLGLLVVVALLIWLGATVMVHALGLDDGGSTGPVGAPDPSPTSSLPTTALPVPSQSPSDDASDSPSPSPSKQGDGDIELSITPVKARPMERINLTGTYQGADNVSLQVQRFANGTWSNFGVQTTVRVGTFATYIQTGRTGSNQFRVWDPQAKQGSNVILVTIG